MIGPTPGIANAARLAAIPTPPPNDAPDAAADAVVVEASLAFFRYSSCLLLSLPAIKCVFSVGTPVSSRSVRARAAWLMESKTPTTVLIRTPQLNTQHACCHDYGGSAGTLSES